MELSSRSKAAALVLGACMMLSGCGAEYMNNWDTVSSRTGNATQANTAIQEITAWPPNEGNTTIVFGD